MNALSYRYALSSTIDPEEVKSTLFLAVLAAECLHGRSRVRLETLFSMDEKERTCLIQAGTEVGQDLARIFTGFLGQEFGDGAFTVECLGGKEPGARAGGFGFAGRLDQ